MTKGENDRGYYGNYFFILIELSISYHLFFMQLIINCGKLQQNKNKYVKKDRVKSRGLYEDTRYQRREWTSQVFYRKQIF